MSNEWNFMLLNVEYSFQMVSANRHVYQTRKIYSLIEMFTRNEWLRRSILILVF